MEVEPVDIDVRPAELRTGVTTPKDKVDAGTPVEKF